MRAKRSHRSVETARLETLEHRLLLDGGVVGRLSSPAADAAFVSSIVQPVLEDESNGGPANDDPAGAQELSFSYLVPKITPVGGLGPQQASVLGTADGSGGAGYSSRLMLWARDLAHGNSFKMDFDGAIMPGAGGVLKVSALGDFEGPDKYLLLAAEGIDLGKLFVDTAPVNGWFTTEVALTRGQLAVLAADGEIVFTVTAGDAVEPFPNGGYVVMDLNYGGGGGTADFYRFDLAAGESVSLSLAGADPGQLDLALFDADGTLLAEGQSGYDNAAAAIEHFVADQAGTFYVQVKGSGDYNLVANRNATMDLEPNDDLAGARQIRSAQVDARQWVVGELGEGGASGGDADVYAVTLSPHGLLDVRAYSPGKPGRDARGLVINVYDAGGGLVATGSGSDLRYRAPRRLGGVYYVEVAAAEEGGAYVLAVKTQSQAAVGVGLSQAVRRSASSRSKGPASHGRQPDATKGAKPTSPKAGKSGSKTNGRSGGNGRTSGPDTTLGSDVGDRGGSGDLQWPSVLGRLPALRGLLS
jgi:hypothetical protein